MPRGARAGSGVVLATSLGLVLAACVNLFHSTNFATACDVNAAACESAEGSASTTCPGPSAAADVCAPTAPADSGQD